MVSGSNSDPVVRALDEALRERDDAVGERYRETGEIPRLSVLHGYLYEIEDEHRYRLYQSLEFDDYLAFAAADLVHRIPPPGESPTGGSIVFLVPDASVSEYRREPDSDDLAPCEGVVIPRTPYCFRAYEEERTPGCW